MFGYIFSAILLVYFCVLWPNFEILPPRSARIKRQRLAGKLGLHDMPSIGELDLTQGQKEDLINCVVFTDGQTFAKICNSKHFYLVESRRSVLSLYCSIDEPIETVNYETLQGDNFIRIQIEEKLLVRFLTELTHIRSVS